MSGKQIVGIVLSGVGAVGLTGVLRQPDDEKLSLLGGSLILIAVGAFLFILGLVQRRRINRTAAQNPPQYQNFAPPAGAQVPFAQPVAYAQPVVYAQPVAYAQPIAPVDGSRDVDMLPPNQDDLIKVYQYNEKLCIIRGTDPYPHVFNAVQRGIRQLTFEFEPDNEYDEDAVMVMLDGQKIGYVYQGTTQDMIHDYSDRGYEAAAHINTFSPSTITYKIAFYKPKDKCRVYTVRYKNQAFAEDHYEGEILSVTYDGFEDCYVIRDMDREYRMPKAVEEYASRYFDVPVEVGEDCESLIFYK